MATLSEQWAETEKWLANLPASQRLEILKDFLMKADKDLRPIIESLIRDAETKSAREEASKETEAEAPKPSAPPPSENLEQKVGEQKERSELDIAIYDLSRNHTDTEYSSSGYKLTENIIEDVLKALPVKPDFSKSLSEQTRQQIAGTSEHTVRQMLTPKTTSEQMIDYLLSQKPTEADEIKYVGY